MNLAVAIRAFRQSPGFVAVAVLMLGLGIGASTTLFSVVDGVLLKQLPHRDADRQLRRGHLPARDELVAV